jgi:hypothetical protein
VLKQSRRSFVPRLDFRTVGRLFRGQRLARRERRAGARAAGA